MDQVSDERIDMRVDHEDSFLGDSHGKLPTKNKSFNYLKLF